MCIYFYLQTFAFICYIYSYSKPQAYKNKLLMFNMFLWVFLMGFRAYTVGPDSYDYALFFEGKYGIYGTLNHPNDSLEIGFLVISQILHFINSSGTWLFLSLSVAVWWCLYKLYKDRENCLLSILWLICINSNVLVILHCIVRQAWSIVFFLLAIILLRKVKLLDNIEKNKNFLSQFRKRIMYNKWSVLIIVVCLLLAMFTHRTSLILMTIAILLFFVPNSKKISNVVLTVVVIVSIFFHDLITNFFQSIMFLIGDVENEKISLLAERYGENLGETSASVIRLISITAPIYLTIYLTDNKTIKTFEFKSLIMSVIIYLLFNEIYMIMRIDILFMIFGYIVAIPSFKGKNKKFIYLYIMFTLYYLWRAYANFEKVDENHFVPYFSIFEGIM